MIEMTVSMGDAEGEDPLMLPQTGDGEVVEGAPENDHVTILVITGNGLNVVSIVVAVGLI